MPLPENPNLDDAQDERDPGNEFEQNEGQDTGNALLDDDVADTAGIDAATRASEPSYTLNLDDDLPPSPDELNDKSEGDKHNLKQ